MEEKNWLWMISKENHIQKIMDMNEKTAGSGLVLTQEDAALLVRTGNETLKEQQRVEFGESILPKIISFFCDSPYIHQDSYVETLIRIQEIFYVYKNESADQLSDDALLEYMRATFNGVCGGSLEYLEGMPLEELIHSFGKERW